MSLEDASTVSGVIGERNAADFKVCLTAAKLFPDGVVRTRRGKTSRTAFDVLTQTVKPVYDVSVYPVGFMVRDVLEQTTVNIIMTLECKVKNIYTELCYKSTYSVTHHLK